MSPIRSAGESGWRHAALWWPQPKMNRLRCIWRSGTVAISSSPTHRRRRLSVGRWGPQCGGGSSGPFCCGRRRSPRPPKSPAVRGHPFASVIWIRFDGCHLSPERCISGHPVSLPLNLAHGCCLGPPLMRTAVTPRRPPARLREGVDHVHGRTAGTGRVGRGQVCGAARAGSLSSAVGRVSRPLLLRAPRKESTVWESRTRSSAKPGVTDPLTLFLFEDLVPVVTFDAEDDHRY